MNDKELITYLLGELDKISRIEPEKSYGIEKFMSDLVSAMFKAKHTALMAIIEAEKHLKN